MQELIDRTDITDLIVRLGEWLDEGAVADPRGILAADVLVETRGGTARGIEAAVAQARRNHGMDVVQHFTTNLRVEVQGDRAVARANQFVVFVPDAAEPQRRRTAAGVYHYDAVRTVDGWRVSRLHMRPTWAIEEGGA